MEKNINIIYLKPVILTAHTHYNAFHNLMNNYDQRLSKYYILTTQTQSFISSVFVKR